MRDDDVELDITTGAGLDPGAPADDAGRSARRWHPALPWAALAVALGVYGVVLADAVPPPPPPFPGVVAPLPDAPSLQWQVSTCSPDVAADVLDDTVLVRGPECVQALDLGTGAQRWRLEREYLTCELASGPLLACLGGDGARAIVVSVDVATGIVREWPAGDVDAVVAIEGDVVEARVSPDGIALRRLAAGGSEVWARTVPVDAEMAVFDAAGFDVHGPVMRVWGSGPGFIDTADGRDAVGVESDLSGRLLASGPREGERRVRSADGRDVGTLEPGQILPWVSDRLDGDTVLVTVPPTISRGPGGRVVAQDRDGRDLWALPRGGWPIAVVGDTVVVVTELAEPFGQVRAFELGSGRERWRAPADLTQVDGVWTDGRRLIVAARQGSGQWLSAIDVATGDEAWRVRVAGADSEGVVALTPDGSAIVRSSDGVAVWR